MNDVSTRERVGREAPLEKEVGWDAFFSPLFVSVTQDVKLGIKIVDVIGNEAVHDKNVPVVELLAEAEKRGWRVVRSKDRIGMYNDHHLAQQAPDGIFTSRNSFISYKVKELKNLCRILGLKVGGVRFALMTRLAQFLSLPLDESSEPAEQPVMIEKVVKDYLAHDEAAQAADAVKSEGIQVIAAPAPDNRVQKQFFCVPYGRARPLWRKRLFVDSRMTEYEPVKGRTLENMVTMLLKTGNYKVTHGPGRHVASDGTVWKCAILEAAVPR